MRIRSGGSRLLALLAAVAFAAFVGFGLVACGGDDSGSDEPELDQALVTENLDKASYEVTDAEPGASQLPSLVDVGFATDSDTGFQGAIQVAGNGLEPFDPTDVSKTGFVLFYESADQAKKVDEDLGNAEGQERLGNALFVYGTGTESPPSAFGEMVGAAEGN